MKKQTIKLQLDCQFGSKIQQIYFNDALIGILKHIQIASKKAHKKNKIDIKFIK